MIMFIIKNNVVINKAEFVDYKHLFLNTELNTEPREQQVILTHSLTGAIPPGGGIGGAAHNRSCVHSRARPERLYVHRRLEPVFLS